MSAFTLCEACRRHVRTGDASCPFCGANVATVANEATVATEATQSPMHAAKGSSRALLYAIATSVAALSCESPRGPSVPSGGNAADAGTATTTTATATTTTTATGTVDPNCPKGPPQCFDRPPNMPYGCVFPDEACTGEIV